MSLRLARLRPVALVALAATLGCQPPRRQQMTVSMPDLHAELDNGLRVIVLPDPSAALVQVDVRYTVGAAEDPPGKAGLAHVVEHMMFQQRPAGPELPSVYAALSQIAVGFNASTDWDATHYTTSVRKEDLEPILAIEAARLSLGCQTIPPGEFVRELEVVRNEIRERSGDPDALADQHILAAVYPEGHAYHRPVGGDDLQLSRLTLDDVCAFTEAHYTPTAATLVIAGNVTPAEVEPLLARYFGGLPRRVRQGRTEVAPLEQARRKIELELDVDQPRLSVVFALPPTYSRLGLVGEETANVLAAHLHRSAYRFGFSDAIDVSVHGGRRAPVLIATVWLRKPSDASDALDAIEEASEAAFLRRVMESWDDEEIQDNVAWRRAALVMRLESLGARTWQFAEWDDLVETAGYLGGALERIGHIDEAELRALARRVLDMDKALVVLVKPKAGAGGVVRGRSHAVDAGGQHARESIVDAAEATQPLQLPAADLIPTAESFTLDNGLRVVLAPTPGAVPVMTARLSFDTGWAHEPADRSGLATVAADYLYSPSVGQFAAEIDYGVGAETTVFEVRGLSIYDEWLVKGIERWSRSYRYSRESLEKLPEEADGLAKDRDRAERLRFGQAMRGALFGAGHPYARLGALTPRSARKIGIDAVHDLADAAYGARNGTLVITGHFDLARARKWVKSQFSHWDSRSAQKPAPAAARPAGAAVIGVAGEARPTMRVSIAYPTPAIDADHGARLILAEMLGQRMAAVRQGLGASYGVDASLTIYRAAGAFVMEGRVDAGRAGEALRAMRGGVAALRAGDDFDLAFAMARRAVLKRLLVAPGTSDGLAGIFTFVATHGLGPNWYDDLLLDVAHARPEEVRRVLERELAPDRESVGLQGPRAAVEQAYRDAGLVMTAFVD